MTDLKKNLIWAFVFLLIIVISAAVLVFHKTFSKPPKTAQILQNGEVIREIDLQSVTKPYELEFVSNDGGHNTVRVENGRIGVTESDCPDKICVRQGFISNGALPIICLPHKLSVVITDDDNSIDAVAGGI